MTRAWRHAGSALVCPITIGLLLIGGVGLEAQQGSTTPVVTHGIAALTAASRQDAIECGNEGESCAIAPYEICPGQATGYNVRIVTPFSRVAIAEMEARRNNQPLGRMGPGSVNGWGIGVTVAPSEWSQSAQSISRLEIQRADGSVIEPKWTVVGPLTTRIVEGATRKLTRGFFVFPAEAFAPTSDVTLVLTGPGGQAQCQIDRARLAALR